MTRLRCLSRLCLARQLAKSRDTRLKMTTSVGTFSHMAPEVMRGKYDLSCDIFSFGIVLTEVLVAEEAQVCS